MVLHFIPIFIIIIKHTKRPKHPSTGSGRTVPTLATPLQAATILSGQTPWLHLKTLLAVKSMPPSPLLAQIHSKLIGGEVARSLPRTTSSNEL
jgi:hypothetical protein